MAHKCTFVKHILHAMRLRIAFIVMLLLFASASAQDNPNFIVILVDDQGWNGTSVQMSDGDPLSKSCLLYTSPSPRDGTKSRMPSSA